MLGYALANKLTNVIQQPHLQFIITAVHTRPISVWLPSTPTYPPPLLPHRFTNVEDTVLGIGVETTTVAEAALEKGRPVEFYVMDEDKRGVLLTKISSSFRSAHSAGHFKVQCVFCCQGYLQPVFSTEVVEIGTLLHFGLLAANGVIK